MDLPLVDDYRRLFLEGAPMLDVRAPVEFNEGAFPGAVNRPLINDAEREEIGIRYKDLGQDAAIDLGHELVKGQTRNKRIAGWQDFARRHPEGVLYCFRGGMRSKISQQWLAETTGIAYPRVEGGYKAMRRFLIDELAAAAADIDAISLGGRTGVGKTVLLQQLPNALDLEGLAWHRGSAFGRHATPQPTQIDFENRLSIALLRHRVQGVGPLLIEDEGKAIGSVHLPNSMHEAFKRTPLVVLEASVTERVEITHQEYIHQALAEYQEQHGSEEGFSQWAAYLLNSLERIRKRLGGVRYQQMQELLETAIARHRDQGCSDAHRLWIQGLLVDYYDPMYDYQIRNNAGRVAFRGDAAAVADYLREKVTAA